MEDISQAKTAFYWDREANRWGAPGGRTPYPDLFHNVSLAS